MRMGRVEREKLCGISLNSPQFIDYKIITTDRLTLQHTPKSHLGVIKG